MEVTELMQLISTVGFPIVCAVGMGFFIYRCFLTITDSNKEREKKLYKIIDDVRQQVDKAMEINASFVSTLEIMDNSIKNLSQDVEEIKAHINSEVEE